MAAGSLLSNRGAMWRSCLAGGTIWLGGLAALADGHGERLVLGVTDDELLASRLGQCPVGDVPGAGGRRCFIERRGEGIAVIEDETFALAGERPVFALIGERELQVVLPAASPPQADGVAVRVTVRHGATGWPQPDVSVLMLYPNRTYREARTDASGRADFVLYAKLPMTVLCAANGLAAHVDARSSARRAAEVRMEPVADGGSLIIADGTGRLPGIQGR